MSKQDDDNTNDFFNRHPVLFGFMAASLWIAVVLNLIFQLLNYFN